MGVHLVTGGSGYFGSVMVGALRARGHTVRVFDLIDSPTRPAEVEWAKGDVRSAADVRRALDGVEVVHHNIAVVPIAKDPDLFSSVNKDGTRILLEESHRVGVRKLVNVSSSAIFGAPDVLPVTEETVPTPGELYGQSKLDGERLCLDQDKVDCTIIRPRTIIGPGRLGIMQIMFEWIRSGRNVPVFDQGASRYQFVHGDDLADACILASERAGKDVFNIGAEQFGTLRETLEGLCAHAGTGSKVTSIPAWIAVPPLKVASTLGLSPLGPYHTLMYAKSLWFDVSKAKRVLGWSAKHDNIGAFRDNYDWYLANRDTILAAPHGSHHRSPVKQGILKLAVRFL